MADGTLILLALGLCVTGMAALALSIDAHWQQVMGDRPFAAVRPRLRPSGAALLAVGFIPCAMADPVSMAALVWPMLLTIAAMLVAFFLTLHAGMSRRP